MTALLPADDESYGFDNIADVLKVSPSLLEQYLAASHKVSSLAVGDPERRRRSARSTRVPPDLAQDDHIEGLPLGTRGGLLIRHNFPLDAEYQFSVKLLRNIVGYMTGLEWPHQLEITVDGERVFIAPVGGPEDNKMSDENMSEAGDKIDERLKARVPDQGGAASGRRDVHQKDVRRVGRAAAAAHARSRPPEHERDSAGSTTWTSGDRMKRPARERRRAAAGFSSAGPASAREEVPCARKILSTLARRAYRRPVTGAEVDALVEFYQDGRQEWQRDDFEAGIQNALRLILASPKFLFRAEPDPAGAAPGTIYRLGDLELASRLSFFLWSSIPDDELLTVATQGKLKDPAVLDQQVRRMLADPRAEALVDELRRPMAVPPQPAGPPARQHGVSGFRRQPAAGVPARDRAVLRQHHARRPQRARPARRELHVRQRAAGAALRHSERLREPVPAGDADRRESPRAARPGKRPDGDVVSEPDLAGSSRQVDPGKHSRHAAAAAAAECAGAHGKRRGRQGAVGAGAARGTPEEPRLRELSSGDGSARVLARELRRDRAVAGQGRGRSGRCLGPARRWHPASTARSAFAQALMKRPEQFVGTMTEKLLTYALGRGLEYYDMPRRPFDCA